MTRKELLLGSFIALAGMSCLFFFFLDYLSTMTRLRIASASGLESVAPGLGLLLAAFSVGSIVVGALFAAGLLVPKAKRETANRLTLRLSANFTDRLRLRAAIPWHYVFLFVPVINGSMLMMLTLNSSWGWLACLSLPGTILFLIIGIVGISRPGKPPQG
jgi:hypothetical protein